MSQQVIDTIYDFIHNEHWMRSLGLQPVEIPTKVQQFGPPSILHARFTIHREDIEGWWFLDLRLCRITADENTIWTAEATGAATEHKVTLPQLLVNNDQLYGDGMFDWMYGVLDIIANNIDAARERVEL